MFNLSEKNSTNPVVSVIITTYNRAIYLKRAIKSVISQTFKNFELIIIDDCSTDNTEQVVNSITDDRIIYFKHKTNLGVHQARNNGIQMARGEFIGFLDDDDEWLPNKLKKQVELFKKLPKEFGIVYSGYLVSLNGKIVSKMMPKFKGDCRDYLLRFNILATSTALVRRSCFDKVGFFEYMISIEDWDMWIRISEYYKFDYVPEALSIYNVHESQVSGNVKRLIIGREIMLNKYYSIWSKYPKILANRLNDLGRLFYYTRYSFQAKRYFIKALSLGIFQYKTFLNLLLSKFLSKYFSNIFTPHNSSVNILKIFLIYFERNYFFAPSLINRIILNILNLHTFK